MRKDTILSLCCMSAQIFILLCALNLSFGTVSEAAPIRKQPAVREPLHSTEMLRILPVLEDKISDKNLLEKSKEKISAMNNHELRLVAALCGKMSEERQGISSDIAFLLVSALIVLS